MKNWIPASGKRLNVCMFLREPWVLLSKDRLAHCIKQAELKFLPRGSSIKCHLMKNVTFRKFGKLSKFIQTLQILTRFYGLKIASMCSAVWLSVFHVQQKAILDPWESRMQTTEIGLAPGHFLCLVNMPHATIIYTVYLWVHHDNCLQLPFSKERGIQHFVFGFTFEKHLHGNVAIYKHTETLHILCHLSSFLSFRSLPQCKSSIILL